MEERRTFWALDISKEKLKREKKKILECLMPYHYYFALRSKSLILLFVKIIFFFSLFFYESFVWRWRSSSSSRRGLYPLFFVKASSSHRPIVFGKGLNITIGGLFFENNGTKDSDILGAQLAIDYFNSNEDYAHEIFQNVSFDTKIKVYFKGLETKGKPWTALQGGCFLIEDKLDAHEIQRGDIVISPADSMVDSMLMTASSEEVRSMKGIHSIVGLSYSSTSIYSAKFCSAFHIPCISYSATSMTLQNKESFPYFARVVPSDDKQAQAMIKFAAEENWSRICIFYEDGDYGLQGASETAFFARDNKIDVVLVQGYDGDSMNMTNIVSNIKEKACRINILWCLDCFEALHSLEEENVVEGGTYTWIMSDGCSSSMAMSNYDNDFRKQLIGTFCLGIYVPPSPFKEEFDNRWRAKGYDDLHGNPSPYSYAAFDAILTAIHAIAKNNNSFGEPFLLNKTREESCLANPFDNDEEGMVTYSYGKYIKESIPSLEFEGVTSGQYKVNFDDSLERKGASYYLWNMQSHGSMDGMFFPVALINFTFSSSSSSSSSSSTTTTGSLENLEFHTLMDFQWSTSLEKNFPPLDDRIFAAEHLKVFTVISLPFTKIKEEYDNVNGKSCSSQCINTNGTLLWSCPLDCYTGYSMDYLKRISEEVGFTYEVHHFEAGSFGGYTTALYYALQINDFDVVIGDFTAKSARGELFDVTYAYYDNAYSMLILKSTNSAKRSSMWTFLLPFSTSLWLFIMVYLILSAIFFGLYEYGLNENVVGMRATDKMKGKDNPMVFRKNMQKTLIASVYWAVTALFGQADIAATTISGRILCAFLYIFNTAFLSAYTANLATILILSQEPAISGFDNIGYTKQIQPNDVCLSLGGSIEIFWKEKYFPNCYNCAKVDESWYTSKCISLLKEGKVKAVIGDEPILTYYALTDPDCMTESIGKENPDGFSFYLRHDSHLTNEMSAAVLKQREKFLNDELFDTYFDGHCTSLETSNGDDLLGRYQLSPQHFYGLLYIGFLGLLVSFVLYIMRSKHRQEIKRKLSTVRSSLLLDNNFSDSDIIFTDSSDEILGPQSNNLEMNGKSKTSFPGGRVIQQKRKNLFKVVNSTPTGIRSSGSSNISSNPIVQHNPVTDTTSTTSTATSSNNSTNKSDKVDNHSDQDNESDNAKLKMEEHFTEDKTRDHIQINESDDTKVKMEEDFTEDKTRDHIQVNESDDTKVKMEEDFTEDKTRDHIQVNESGDTKVKMDKDLSKGKTIESLIIANEESLKVPTVVVNPLYLSTNEPDDNPMDEKNGNHEEKEYESLQNEIGENYSKIEGSESNKNEIETQNLRSSFHSTASSISGRNSNLSFQSLDRDTRDQRSSTITTNFDEIELTFPLEEK